MKMGELKTFRRLWVALILVFGISVSHAWAEIDNAKDIYEESRVCDTYLGFLGDMRSRPESRLDDCHDLATFLIQNDTPEIRSFLRKLMEFVTEGSTFGAMASTSWAVIHGDPLQSYISSEVAGRRISIRMASSGDLERAVLYSHILSEVQRMAVQSICINDAECSKLIALNTTSEIIGEEFKLFDESRADILLICLLKVDAFLVPIKNVMRSPKYMVCVAAIEES
jgi:hypothetical protein